MAKIIRINEGTIKKMVYETVRTFLKESMRGPIPFFFISFNYRGGLACKVYRNVSNENKLYNLIKQDYPHLSSITTQMVNPDHYDESKLSEMGFVRIIDPDKPKPEKTVIGKPDGMSDEEYYQTLVKPNNKKVAAAAIEGEEWKNFNNYNHRYFHGDLDLSKSYAVSNYGNIRILDYDDVSKCRNYNPYPAPTRNAMQISLKGDVDGETKATCPDVKYIVADAWLEPHDTKEWMVVHKDGDWHNNKVDNLMWVPRKKAEREKFVAEPAQAGAINEGSYGYEKKNGKYYLYTNGVRQQVSKDTWEKSKEDDRQERIKRQCRGDRCTDILDNYD